MLFSLGASGSSLGFLKPHHTPKSSPFIKFSSESKVNMYSLDTMNIYNKIEEGGSRVPFLSPHYRPTTEPGTVHSRYSTRADKSETEWDRVRESRFHNNLRNGIQILSIGWSSFPNMECEQKRKNQDLSAHLARENNNKMQALMKT